ncbi:MAG: peptidoglycan DD-transpeptidase MrdA [Candidatus Westeberhardia cardiocondylae]|nr:peptidoglycan DD-transpeptidase MrdA [Candidatus Westeberhardia cardiocondylae]
MRKTNLLCKIFVKFSLFKKRLILICMMMMFLFCFLVINLYYLQVISCRKYTLLSNKNRIKFIPIEPIRGIIYDCHGVPLVLNKIVYHLEIVPDKIKNLNETICLLRCIVHLTDNDIANFEKEKKNIQYSFLSIPIKKNLTDSQKASFLVNQHRFPGVFIKSCSIRYYPYGELLSHILGYVSNIKNNQIKYKSYGIEDMVQMYSYANNFAKSGIEFFYNDVLCGMPGYKVIEVNNKGKIIRKLHERFPISGRDITLTIDISLQKYIQNLLANDFRSCAVVADPNTGEIRALVSHPSYDPNLFVNGISKSNFFLLLQNKDAPLINRVTQGVYSPASTIKPYILFSALTLQIIKQDFLMFDPGWWKLPQSHKYYHDWKKSGHGLFNVITALGESVDILFYQLAYNMGIDLLSQWMMKFGYGKITGIDLLEENIGVMPTKDWKRKKFKKSWYMGDTILVGIGRGYWTATPIQMLKSLMILINNGNIVTPHLCYSINIKNKNKILYEKLNNEKIGDFFSQYYDIVKYGMYFSANCDKGTDYKDFYNSTYKSAVKSGATQLYSLKNSENYDVRKISEYLQDHKLMVSFAPFDNPIVASVVVLENSNTHVTVGEITRKILDYVMLRSH